MFRFVVRLSACCLCRGWWTDWCFGCCCWWTHCNGWSSVTPTSTTRSSSAIVLSCVLKLFRAGRNRIRISQDKLPITARIFNGKTSKLNSKLDKYIRLSINLSIVIKKCYIKSIYIIS